MSTFDRYLQHLIERAGAETARDGSATVEAHHLLLVIAREPDTPAHEVLAAAGLGHDRVEEALDREYLASLRAAGFSHDRSRLPLPTPSPAPQRLGTSSIAAIKRIAAQFRKSELGSAHLLLGIMQAQVGIVPRALELAGVDRAAVLVRIDEAIGAGTAR